MKFRSTMILTLVVLFSFTFSIIAFSDTAGRDLTLESLQKSINEELKEIKARIFDVETGIKNLQEKIDALQKAKADEKQMVLDTQKKMNALEAKVNEDLSSLSSEIDKKVKDMVSKFETILNDVKTNKKDIESLKALLQEFKSLKNDVTSLNSVLGDLNKKIKELAQENAVFKKKLDELVAEKESMGQKLSKVKEDFALSQKESQKKMEELEKKIKRKAGGMTTFMAWLAFLLGILALVILFMGKGSFSFSKKEDDSQTEESTFKNSDTEKEE